jgi:hypothetical protein
MALQSQAQLLDELMGKNRNIAPGATIKSARYDDDDTCKFSLCGFCPHDLFVNTRADLGPCNKVHDEQLRAQYEKSSRHGRLGYEDDYERFLRSLLMDVERKIKRGQERLRLTQSDMANQKTPIQMKQERVDNLKEQINDQIRVAERFGEEGKIEEAQATLADAEKLKSECKYPETQLEFAQNNMEQKQMEVCEVCGSFLIVNDAQSRVEEHISGKQHMGYAKLRTALDDIRKKRLDEYEKRETERKTKRDQENGSSSSSSRDRYRDRDRDRDNRGGGGGGSDRDRDRDRERERERERDRGSNTRKDDLSRSRNSTRERSRSRGAGNASDLKRSRHSRSKSRDRKSLKINNNNNNNNNHVNGKESEDGGKSKKNEKLERETDEFLKIGNSSFFNS